MKIVACIQSRMGSSRLPGKVMLPLDCDHVLEHDIRRVASADKIDEVVVATTKRKNDDILVRYAQRAEASVYRGSEEDVLGRIYEAAHEHDADVVIRVTADCPLVSVKYINEAVDRLLTNRLDYVSGLIDRTFPRGTESEVFMFNSFRKVERASDEPRQREHVTPYFYENPNEFSLHNITSNEVFGEKFLQDRMDLRLTLDEADDYELLRQVYKGVEYDKILNVTDAVQYIDENNLSQINKHVEQKKV